MREDGDSSRSSGRSSSSNMHSDTLTRPSADDGDEFVRQSSSSTSASYAGDYPMTMSSEGSPFVMSPWHQSASVNPPDLAGATPGNGLITSLFREEGHIYSLAAVGDVLYTGSDSKNIRVWKNQKEFAGFKSSSGLVKSIVAAGDRIFSGHQDGKIRVWRVSPKNPTVHKRIGNLPCLKDVLRSSLKPCNYIEVRRHRSALWIRHSDAISCLSLDQEQGLLYSGSWDKTFKVWRIADSRCLESVIAHDDAVNSVVASSGGLVFTGSADGTVKVWRRELLAKTTKHSPVKTLLKREYAVTSLAVSSAAPLVYCGSSDGLVHFWEGEAELAQGGVLGGHKMAVLCLVAAGSLLVSGSADKNICVWRREGAVHSCLLVLSGHTGPVKCLAVVANGQDKEVEGGAAVTSWILYSGSLDKSVKMWRVSEQPPDALQTGPDERAREPRQYDYTRQQLCRGGAPTVVGLTEIINSQCQFHGGFSKASKS